MPEPGLEVEDGNGEGISGVFTGSEVRLVYVLIEMMPAGTGSRTCGMVLQA